MNADRSAAIIQFGNDRATAKAALLMITNNDVLLSAIAARLCLTRRQLTAKLHDWSKWEPKRLIKLHKEWV